MVTDASLVDVDDRSVQNAQELSSIWGAIRTEFEDHEAEMLDSDAILGGTTFSSSSTRPTASRRLSRR